MSVRWKRLGSASAAPYPSPEFFRGVIPPPDSLAEYAELYFTRAAGCCFYLPRSGTDAWETYDGRWRFGVVMDDGGRPEAGVPAVLQLTGERTDAPMAAPADFTLSAVDGGLLSNVRWWFMQPMANTFNGDSIPFVREPPPSTFTLPVPRYPDAQRTTVVELTECATQVTCRYQAPAAGAVVAMATLADGRVLGARATPALACGVAGVSGLRAAGRSLAAACEPPAPPTLKLECPSSSTRGEKIACELRLSDATLVFSVSEVEVYATSGTSGFSIVLSAPGPIAAGAVYRMEGPAVATTRLSAKGTVAWRGQTLNLVGSTSFVVKERPRELDEYVMTLAPKADGPGRTTKFPSTNRGGSTLGLYRRQPPLFDSLQIATAATGPNRGLSYVVSVPGIPASLINLTFAIFPGDPWYEAHPVQPGPLNDAGVLICTRSKIDDLRLQAERHEGVTLASNSHYGLDQAFLRRVKLGAFIGAHVSNVAGSPDQIRRQMALELMQEWSREDAYLWILQRAFDAKDVPAMLAALGCSIYLKD